MRKKKYTLDDLPRFSPWPARLLGLEPWGQRTKSSDEILREYEHENWGPLLAIVANATGRIMKFIGTLIESDSASSN